jgi:hypothetical protein
MSDDLVNQITLNFLISKQQMQKLNKKIKQKEEDKMKTDMEIYREQIVELFTKFINDEFPDDLLEDVKHSYTYFIEKSIYYLKMHVEGNERLTVHTVASLEDDLDDHISDNNEESLEEDEDISDNDEDLDDDLEDHLEDKEDLEEDLDDDLEEVANEVAVAVNLVAEIKKANEVVEETVAVKEEVVYPRVYKKLHKSTNSKGVDDIQKLPLDWFNTVRQNYKQNQIIPRQKDKKEIVLKSPNNYKNTEKKNISNLYEDKSKDKKNTK